MTNQVDCPMLSPEQEIRFGWARQLQPWEKRPRELISWYEMLQFSALQFFWCGRALRAIKLDCLTGSLPFSSDTPIFHLSAPLDDKAREKALYHLPHVEEQFRSIGLQITADTIKELIQTLKEPNQSRENFQWLMDQVSAIEKLAEKELHGKLFLYVPAEQSQFWPSMKQPNSFGDAVADKFPSTTFDAANAGVCLAVGLSTSAVFHLMRVLEIGLAALGNVFNVSLAHTNWGPAIGEIESKIRNMHTDPKWKALPDCKEQQEFYAQAASHFGVLKDAWRNYTMHARGKYIQEEATRMFDNTKGFMQKLAERLHE